MPVSWTTVSDMVIDGPTHDPRHGCLLPWSGEPAWVTAEGKSSTENCAAVSPGFFGLTLEVCTSREAFPGIRDSAGRAERCSAQ